MCQSHSTTLGVRGFPKITVWPVSTPPKHPVLMSVFPVSVSYYLKIRDEPILHPCATRIRTADNRQVMSVHKSEFGFLFTWFENTRISSLKDSDEQTSPPAIRGSRGVQVASSHFSKISARSGNRGWLKNNNTNLILMQYYETEIKSTVCTQIRRIYNLVTDEFDQC